MTGRLRRMIDFSSYRARLCSRVAAGVLGGYLLANAWALSASALFPGGAEAVLAGAQLGVLWHLGALIWAFSPVPLGRVWWGLLVPAAVLALVAAMASILHFGA